MSDKMLTYKDLSERWQVPVSTLRIWVMQGKLKRVKLGRLVRFLLGDILEIEQRGLNNA